MKLGQVFDPRNNALNALRLGLAAEVILWHSFRVTGHDVSSKPVVQLLFSVGVDGFFALSGFLIASSWLRHPQVRDYLVARGLRILPALYVCLVVTAFVFAPISVAVQGGSPMQLLRSGAPFGYVLNNSTPAATADPVLTLSGGGVAGASIPYTLSATGSGSPTRYRATWAAPPRGRRSPRSSGHTSS